MCYLLLGRLILADDKRGQNVLGILPSSLSTLRKSYRAVGFLLVREIISKCFLYILIESFHTIPQTIRMSFFSRYLLQRYDVKSVCCRSRKCISMLRFLKTHNIIRKHT